MSYMAGEPNTQSAILKYKTKSHTLNKKWVDSEQHTKRSLGWRPPRATALETKRENYPILSKIKAKMNNTENNKINKTEHLV